MAKTPVTQSRRSNSRDDVVLENEVRDEEAERTLPDVASLSPAQRNRRQRLIESALELLMTSEGNVEIRDVVDHADVSLATVYRYFGSKEILFAAAYLHWRDQQNDQVATALARGKTDGERMRAAASGSVDVYKRYPQLWDVSVATRGSRLPEIVAMRRDNDIRTWELYLGAMHDVPAADAKGIASILIAVFVMYMSQWRAGDIPIEDVHAALDNAVRLTVDVRGGATARAEGSAHRSKGAHK